MLTRCRPLASTRRAEAAGRAFHKLLLQQQHSPLPSFGWHGYAKMRCPSCSPGGASMPASQMAPSQMDRPTGRPYEYGSQVQWCSGGARRWCRGTLKPSIAIAVCGRHLPRCAGPHTWAQAPCSIVNRELGRVLNLQRPSLQYIRSSIVNTHPVPPGTRTPSHAAALPQAVAGLRPARSIQREKSAEE